MATALDNLLIQVGGAKNAGVSGGTGGNNLNSLYSQVVGGKYQSPVSPYSTKVSEPVSEPVSKPNKVTEFLSKSQKLAQDVSTKAGAVSKQVSDKITPIAQRAIPQLDPSQKMEAPKLDKLSYDVPNKPGKMDIFDFKSVETTGSAQLSPKAKADSQKKVDDFLKTPTGKQIVKAGNVIDHFAASLSGERERIKKDLTQLATRGVVTTVGSPRERADSMVDWKSEKARQLLVLDDPKNISSRLNKAWGLALVGNIEGLTGGVLKADKVEPKTIEGKVVYGVAQVMGTVVALRMIGGAFNSLASGSTKIADFVAKYPKWGKHVVALGKNVAAFDIYGQLDPDIQNRLEKLALDTATGTIFSGLSMIKQGVISIPMNFAIGFGLAKSQGASNEDAFIAGGILATLDAASRGSRKLFEPQFKAKGGRLTMTPDEAAAQVAGSDLKGTPAGDQINQLAMQAKIQGKNLQIEMTAGKVSSLAQDLLRVQTPKGAQFTVTLVDPPPKVTGKTKTSQSAKPKEAPAIEPSSVKPTAESSGFADTVAKDKLKIKPGETIGEFQIRSQQARGQSLLAEYDIAMKANDLQSAQSIARKIVADPAYAAYHQQFAKRTGIDMLMKLQQAQQSGDQAEIVRVTDEIRAMGQPKSVTGEVPSPPPQSPVPAMAAASTVTKPATEVKPETKPEAKPEPAEIKPVEKPEDKPKRRTIKTENLPEGVNAIATTRPDGTASLTVHVDPEQQGKGYGAQAVKQLETKLISEGITEVKINADMHKTDPGVQSSVGFWEKMGYVKAGLPKGYFQPMSKDLSKQIEKVVEQKTVPIEDTSREPKKLYRGSNGEVSEVVKTWDKILVVETNQAELIKQLADQGNKAARELYDSMPNKAKVEYVIADPIIKDAYPNYDAIQYNNNHPKLKAQGTTYFETSSGRSFAEKEETAKVYAMGTGRPDKHKSKIEKKDAKPKAEYKKEDFDSELLVTKGYDLPELDAQIRSVEEPTKDYNRWIVEVGLQESLGEQGGDILTLTYDKEPTLKDVKDDIREEYKQKKAEINEEVVPGVVAKSGRDEMIEGAIDKVTAADKLTENTEKMLEYLEKADVKDIEETAENIRVAIDALWVKKIDTQPEWMTEIRNLGSTRFYDMPGGVTAALQILEYDNTIWLKRIEVSDKGKGTGTTIINKIKDYADKSNQKLVILSPKYNLEFWKKFDYLTKNENGNYEYVPEKRPEVLAGIEKDIPYQTAMNAHQGTSFYPEKRGKSEIAGYVETLESDYKELQVYATTPEKQATLDRMFGYLRDGYRRRYLDLLVAKSRVMSSMITGSARFPVARNQNKLNAADNKSKELSDYHDKMYKKIINELNPQTFKGTSEKTIDQMGEKLAKLKANQELMKAANKIIQSDKDVEPRLKELGLSDATIKSILAGDWMGRKGYPSYRLTSINNKIKTLEKRQAVTVAKREKFNTTGNDEVKIGDVTVIKNYDQNRLQLKFPGKPPDEMRANLKSAGFRWSPFNKVWQRVLTNDAIWRTKKLLGVDKLFAETKPAPTEEVPIVPVTDPSEVQRIQNSIDEGEMIIRAGTRNGRKISLEEEESIQRSIDNAKAKIGKTETKPEAVEPKPETKPEVKPKPKPATKTAPVRPKQLISLLNKNNVPILENILVKDGVMQLTDLEKFISLKTDVEDGLYRVVGDELVASTDNVDDWPEIPVTEKEYQLSVPAPELATMLTKLVPAVTKDDTRPILQSVVFTVSDSELNLTATDGMMISHQRMPVVTRGFDQDISLDLAIPGSKIDKLVSILGDGEVKISSSTDSDRSQTEFKSDLGTITFRNRQGEYPPYEKIYQTGFKNQLEFDKKSLQSALKEMTPFLKLSKDKTAVEILIEDGKATMNVDYSADGYGVGNLKKTIPLELIKQNQVNIGQGILDGTMVMPFRRFDTASSEGLYIQKPFLNDALKTIEGVRVFLSYNELNGLKPVHFSNKLEVPYTIKPKFIAKTKPSEPPKPSQKSYSSKNPMSNTPFTEELPRIGTGREDVKIETIKIIEFPEMLKIVRELTGSVPKLKKSRAWAGIFDQMLEQIVLNPKIFESEMQAARVFAHEIGHLTDYLAKSGKTLKRGNLLGRLASLSGYRKHFISDRPPATSDLITPEDRDRLRKEAIRLSKEPVEVEKEVVIDEIAVEPKEILDIWNSTKSSIKNPELLKYIQTLSSAEKVSIVKAALQGVVPEWVKFTKQVKQIITVKEFRKAPEDIKKLYRKLLAEEVEKRHLISLEAVREELKQLSYAWRPLNPDGSSRGEMSYRNSGIELYADAISVLFNDPVRLEQDAPIFYRSFFNYLDNKPEAKEAFFDAWHLLNQGEDAVLGQRLESIDKMFKNAEDKAKALKHERDAVRRDVMFELKYQFLNEYQPASDLVKNLKKAGKQIDPDDNPQYALNSYNYLGSKIRSFLDREINPWYSKLAEKGVTWDDVGKLMLLDRIIGERKNIANPLGLSQSTAEPTREKMLKELGEVKTKNLQEAVDLFREAYRKVMDDAYIRGQLYGEDLYKQISENNTYATYRVTDYLDKNVSAKIYKQIGTLKDIGNPATATMAKMIATIRATERAVTNRKMIDLLKKEAPGEIELAKTRWNGRRQEPVKPTDGRGLVINMENGKAVGYYVDPFIADMISYTGLNNTNIAVDLFKKTNSSWFRPIFTGINLGFMVWNVERDFIRPWKAMGNVSIGRYTANYVKALKPVAKRSLGIFDKDINEMEQIEALAPTFNELTAGMTEEDTQMSVLWDRYSGHGKDKLTLKKMYLNLFWPLQELANVIEKLPKVATYYSLKDKIPTAELANFIRTKGGSPDFLARGKVTAITNPIFLFSNAMAQSMYADYDTMTNPKTRMGFWFKTFLLNILPKLLMKAAIMGLFGTFIKKLYDNISEYNMTNYNPIPWGIDENEKTVWTPGVSDHTGQLIGGITWKMLNLTNNQTLEEGLKDLFAYVSGNTLPSFSPIVEAGSTTLQYLQGQNPYDSYRNREIMSDTEFAAGGMYSLIPFLKYQFQSLGGSIIFGGSVLEKSKSGNVSELEKVINLPIASNVLQRLIRVSDYGRQEKYRKLADQKTRELARIRLEDNKIIDDAVSSVQNGADKRGTEKELVNTIRGDQKVTPEIESRMNYARSNFRLALIRGQNDPDINALIYAGGNQQKAVILKGLEENMDSDQFDEFLKEALVNKVISAEVLNIYRRM